MKLEENINNLITYEEHIYTGYGCKQNTLGHESSGGIEPLKVRHDVTKLDLTVPLLSFCVLTVI